MSVRDDAKIISQIGECAGRQSCCAGPPTVKALPLCFLAHLQSRYSREGQRALDVCRAAAFACVWSGSRAGGIGSVGPHSNPHPKNREDKARTGGWQWRPSGGAVVGNASVACRELSPYWRLASLPDSSSFSWYRLCPHSLDLSAGCYRPCFGW